MKRLAISALAAAVGGACLLTMRPRLALVKVVGRSMEPTYTDGDRLLAWRRPRRVRHGQVVIFKTPSCVGSRGPRPPWLIKRVVAVHGESVGPNSRLPELPPGIIPAGSVAVLGDRGETFDSRIFGPVPLQDILGVPVLRVQARGRNQRGASR